MQKEEEAREQNFFFGSLKSYRSDSHYKSLALLLILHKCCVLPAGITFKPLQPEIKLCP